MKTSTIATAFTFIMSNLGMYTSKTTWADKLSALGTVKGLSVKHKESVVKASPKTTKLRKSGVKKRNKVGVKAPRFITKLFNSDVILPMTGGQKTSLMRREVVKKQLSSNVANLAARLNVSVQEVLGMGPQAILQMEEGAYHASIRKAAREVIEAVRNVKVAVKAARLA